MCHPTISKELCSIQWALHLFFLVHQVKRKALELVI